MDHQNPVLQFIQSSAVKLKPKGIKNIQNEIIWYLEAINCITKTKLYTNKIHLNNTIKSRINKFILLKQQNIPLQYILRKTNFYNRDFFVNHSTLIPRPETETIINYLKGKFYNRALEIGTGSGVIALTLLQEKIVNQIIATDISKQALQVVRRNIKLHNTNNIKLKTHNILKQNINGKFNLIISNPPYITLEEYNKLPKHIKQYEPKIALTDGKDGLTFYKRFANILNNNLKNKGIFVCELGYKKHIPIIQRIFTNKGFFTKIIDDLNHDPRVFVVSYDDF